MFLRYALSLMIILTMKELLIILITVVTQFNSINGDRFYRKTATGVKNSAKETKYVAVEVSVPAK